MSETTEIKADADTSDSVSLTDVTISVETTLVPSSSSSDPETPPEAALEELKTEVLSAVRGAITGVMSRHHPAVPEPDLDFDFHLREEPASETAEAPPDFQQALSDAVAAADPPDESYEPQAPPAEDELLLVDEVPISHREPALAVATAFEDSPGDETALPEPELTVAVADGLPMSLVPSSSPPLPVHVPLPFPVRSQWPAWTTAALLSLSGIAVGAGAATIMIEPGAFGTLRDRINDGLQAAIGTSAPETVAEADSGKRETSPAVAPVEVEPATAVAPASSSDESAALEPAPPTPLVSGGSSIEAPVTEPVVAQASPPQIEPLADAVRVASAGEAAAFAHRMRKPLGAGAISLSIVGSAPSGALAALPPQVAAPASPTGGETASAPAALAKAPPAKDDVSVAAVEPVPASEEVDEGSASATASAPLSAMARANAALSKGDVDAARLLLQAESEAGQVEGMLLLARSYDPSYLATLGIDVAKGKRDVAEKLYRAWYQRSVKLGLVSEGVNIDRLLRAMARAKP